MGWKEKEQSPILKWADYPEETVVTGTMIGIQNVVTKFGESSLLRLRGEKGSRLTYQCPAALLYRLEDVPEGTPVKIQYRGKNAQGHYDFKVVVWEGEGLPPDENQEDLPF
jgi:hypothetical protein